MKTKQFLSTILAVLFVLSVSITAFAETTTFSKSFANFEEMKPFIEKYAADYPYVDYATDKIFTPAKGYELKYKELLEVTPDESKYDLESLMCGEEAYDMGVCYTNARYKKADDSANIRICVDYKYASQRVGFEVAQYYDSYDPSDYQVLDNGQLSSYDYVVVKYLSDGKENYRYIIAVDDVLITCYADMYDKEFLDSLVIEKTGVIFPVNEAVADSSYTKYEVSDELLSAVRVEYDNAEIEKYDICISDLIKISDNIYFVRYTVRDVMYTCDEVYQNIGDYVFSTPQRPLPQVLYDGVLYELKDAYDNGIVNDSDIDVIDSFESRNFYFVHKDELRGDITGDLAVDVYDATAIQRCLAGLSKLSWYDGEEYADFDGDGVVSIIDATGIQKKVAKLK